MSESIKRASALVIVPAAFLVHNLEEAVTIPAGLPLVRKKLEAVLGHQTTLLSANQYGVALLALTLAAFVLWLMALRWESLAYALVVLQATMAFNVVNHVGGAVVLGGYAPGVATAVAVETVVSVVVYRLMKRAGWMSRVQWVLLPLLAVLLDGPVVFGIVMLVGRL